MTSCISWTWNGEGAVHNKEFVEHIVPLDATKHGSASSMRLNVPSSPPSVPSLNQPRYCKHNLMFFFRIHVKHLYWSGGHLPAARSHQTSCMPCHLGSSGGSHGSPKPAQGTHAAQLLTNHPITIMCVHYTATGPIQQVSRARTVRGRALTECYTHQLIWFTLTLASCSGNKDILGGKLNQERLEKTKKFHEDPVTFLQLSFFTRSWVQ